MLYNFNNYDIIVINRFLIISNSLSRYCQIDTREDVAIRKRRLTPFGPFMTSGSNVRRHANGERDDYRGRRAEGAG